MPLSFGSGFSKVARMIVPCGVLLGGGEAREALPATMPFAGFVKSRDHRDSAAILVNYVVFAWACHLHSSGCN